MVEAGEAVSIVPPQSMVRWPAYGELTAAMSRGGVLIEYGGLSPEPTPFPLFDVLSKTLTLRGYPVHEITSSPAKLEASQGVYPRWVGHGRIEAGDSKDV